ncbi:MAG: acylphosphatase, partial [Gammaproteobacteria bacterium]|nr:acylphosphatase [Gammaproteobacteria bacterium]
MSTIAKRFLVTGRVQGVFFRASTRDEAVRLGLRGSATNLPDGRVEVLAAGEAAAVNALGKWLETGPRLAEVLEVESAPTDESELPADFR